ncbi:MAG: right-handed parallel beta-helix repeat-containing protein [Planctomycetes bacterium]|nr:right-handed parallel beta-helix repeat-containing protein [Planctomycetota bacterium]
MPMPLIQFAISTSASGTTFLFAPGTYFGSLVVAQDVVLQGAGAATTTIDALGAQVSVLTFLPGVTRNAVVSGFRLTGGQGDPTNFQGGGVHCTDASPTVRNCVIAGNGALAGGGVYVYGHLASTGRSLLMEDCIVRGNVSSNNGGGIVVTKAPNITPGAPATFIRCEVDGNTGAGNGGGVYVNSTARPVFDHCVVHDNAAQTGGGIFWYEGAAPTISDCAITGNTAATGGGISYRETGNAVLTHCSIVDNVANGTGLVDGGGGLNGFMDGPLGTLAIRNCLFAGNYAANDGGAIRLADSAPNMRFVTIADNRAGGLTGGLRYVFNGPSMFALRNSIVWGNRDSSSGSYGANVDGTTAGGLPTIEFTDVEFGNQNPALFPPASGNIDADPLFVIGYTCKFAPNGAYFLAQVPQGVATNPCVDTASSGPGSPAIVGRSTRTDGRPDGGLTADRGFHYPVPGCP